MKLEHVAVWTNSLESLKDYYIKYFGAKANNKYINKTSGFESYFLSFESGSRIEIMCKPGIPDNANDTVEKQHTGIIHLAFEADSIAEVDEKLQQLKNDGYPILKGPRITGDGYYEFETLDPDKNRVEVTTKA